MMWLNSYKLLLVAQLLEFKSLEEMSDALVDEDLQKALGFESISASQLSRKNNQINPLILANLFLDLVWKIQRYHYKNGKNMPLKIIDLSTLPLNLTNYKWAKFRKALIQSFAGQGTVRRSARDVHNRWSDCCASEPSPHAQRVKNASAVNARFRWINPVS